MDQKKNEMKTEIGYDKFNGIPIVLYFDDGYLNKRVELSVSTKTWKVYFYSVAIGHIDNEESCN